MKKFPPVIWGGILITIIFVAIVILVNALTKPTPAASLHANQPDVASSATPPAETPSVTAEAPLPETVLELMNHESVLFFPALPVNIYQYSLIQIKNIDSKRAEDIKVTLLNRAGESQTYSINNLEPNSINRFSLKNLSGIPINFSPGLVIVSSDRELAALAEIFSTAAEETVPDETLAPVDQTAKDLSFTVYAGTDNEPAQNRLIITNPANKLIEAQVTLTSPASGSQIVFTGELAPLTSHIVELNLPKFADITDRATVNVSGTSYIIGTIYRLDKNAGLLSNIQGR